MSMKSLLELAHIPFSGDKSDTDRFFEACKDEKVVGSWHQLLKHWLPKDLSLDEFRATLPELMALIMTERDKAAHALFNAPDQLRLTLERLFPEPESNIDLDVAYTMVTAFWILHSSWLLFDQFNQIDLSMPDNAFSFATFCEKEAELQKAKATIAKLQAQIDALVKKNSALQWNHENWH